MTVDVLIGAPPGGAPAPGAAHAGAEEPDDAGAFGAILDAVAESSDVRGSHAGPVHDEEPDEPVLDEVPYDEAIDETIDEAVGAAAEDDPGGPWIPGPLEADDAWPDDASSDAASPDAASPDDDGANADVDMVPWDGRPESGPTGDHAEAAHDVDVDVVPAAASTVPGSPMTRTDSAPGTATRPPVGADVPAGGTPATDRVVAARADAAGSTDATGERVPAGSEASAADLIATTDGNEPVAARTGQPVSRASHQARPLAPGTPVHAPEAAGNTEEARAVPGEAAAVASDVVDVPERGRSLNARLFARALERAAAQSAAAERPVAEAESGPSAEQGSDRSSLGQWLREMLGRPPDSGRGAPAQPAFPVSTVFALDGRVPGLQALAAPAGTGAPALPAEGDVTAQMLASLRLQFRDGIGEAVLKLRPEHLGSVSISMRVENGGIRAHVMAEVPAVRQWLESQQDLLRSGLAEHGLRLDRFTVDPDGRRDGSAEERRDAPSRRQRHPSRADREQTPVFDVTV